MSRIVLLVPLALLMVQLGLVLTTTLYYLAISRVTGEHRPLWYMAIGKMLLVIVLAIDVAEHSHGGFNTVWRPVVYSLVSVIGIAASIVVLRYEIRSLRGIASKAPSGSNGLLRALKDMYRLI